MALSTACRRRSQDKPGTGNGSAGSEPSGQMPAGAKDRGGDPRRRRDRRPGRHQPMVPLPRHGPIPRPRSGRGPSRAELVLQEPGSGWPADRRTPAIPAPPAARENRHPGHPSGEHHGAHGPGPRLGRGLPAEDRARRHDLRGRRDPDRPLALSSIRPESRSCLLGRNGRGQRNEACPEPGPPKYTIHELQHRYASRALALGESLTMIGKLLGHTRVQTTARYAHLAQDSIQTAAARITAALLGTCHPFRVKIH